ncbi:hypothetical protein ACFC34_38220 [Streptomyces sp. NPDC056053]|uniref:hypothetical protein n=1 Tax=Streptomyces sp. NPDC056053 TaxID=3345696 RepID=UPI0035DEE446
MSDQTPVIERSRDRRRCMRNVHLRSALLIVRAGSLKSSHHRRSQGTFLFSRALSTRRPSVDRGLVKEPEVFAVLIGSPLVLLTAWASYAAGKRSARAAVDAVRRQELETALRDVANATLEFHSYCSEVVCSSPDAGPLPDRPHLREVTGRFVTTLGRIQNGTLAAGDLVHDAGADLQKAAADLKEAVCEALTNTLPQAALHEAHADFADARGAFLLACRIELSVFPKYSLGSSHRLTANWSASGSDGSHHRTGTIGHTTTN